MRVCSTVEISTGLSDGGATRSWPNEWRRAQHRPDANVRMVVGQGPAQGPERLTAAPTPRSSSSVGPRSAPKTSSRWARAGSSGWAHPTRPSSIPTSRTNWSFIASSSTSRCIYFRTLNSMSNRSGGRRHVQVQPQRRRRAPGPGGSRAPESLIQLRRSHEWHGSAHDSHRTRIFIAPSRRRPGTLGPGSVSPFCRNRFGPP